MTPFQPYPRSIADLRGHIEDFAANLGFPCYGFACDMVIPRSDGARNLHLLSNQPEDWRTTLERASREPLPHDTIRHSWLHLPPCGWSADGHIAGLAIRDELAVAHADAMERMHIRSQIVCPVSAPEIEWGCLVFSSPTPTAHGALSRLVSDCAWYASHFAFWYLQIVRSRTRRRTVRLSPRESECLLWASQGKTAVEIAALLRISERTVEGHFASAAGKLSARSRSEAIARARELRLLSGRNALLGEFERQRDAAIAPPQSVDPRTSTLPPPPKES